MMIRTSVFLTEEQMSRLRAYATSTGLKFSEVLRRIVDDWLQRNPLPPSPAAQKP